MPYKEEEEEGNQAQGSDHDALLAMSKSSLAEMNQDKLQELSLSFMAEVNQDYSNYFRSYSNNATDSALKAFGIIPDLEIEDLNAQEKSTLSAEQIIYLNRENALAAENPEAAPDCGVRPEVHEEAGHEGSRPESPENACSDEVKKTRPETMAKANSFDLHKSAIDQLSKMFDAFLGGKAQVVLPNGLSIKLKSDGTYQVILPNHTELTIDPKQGTVKDWKKREITLATNEKKEIVFAEPEKNIEESKISIKSDGSIKTVEIDGGNSDDALTIEKEYPKHGKWIKTTDTFRGNSNEDYELKGKDGQSLELPDGTTVSFERGTIVIKQGENAWKVEKGEDAKLTATDKSGSSKTVDVKSGKPGENVTRSDNVREFDDGTVINIKVPGSPKMTVTRPGGRGTLIQASINEKSNAFVKIWTPSKAK